MCTIQRVILNEIHPRYIQTANKQHEKKKWNYKIKQKRRRMFCSQNFEWTRINEIEEKKKREIFICVFLFSFFFVCLNIPIRTHQERKQKKIFVLTHWVTSRLDQDKFFLLYILKNKHFPLFSFDSLASKIHRTHF